MSDIYLLSVPNRNIDYPALSLPTLAGRLRKDGFDVTQKDINILVKDGILKTEVLRALKSFVLPALIAKNIFEEDLQKYFIKLNSYLKTVDKQWSFEAVEKIKNLMQQREYEKILVDKEGFEVSLAIFKINRMLHNFIEYYACNEEEVSALFEKANIKNPILSVVEETIQDIVDNNPYLLGLTVLEIQRNFAFYFIKKLKNKYKGKIAVGGADPTRHTEKYSLYFNDLIDFVILKEGEDSLSTLLLQIKTGKQELEKISGITYVQDGKVVVNPPKPISPCRIVSPDFDGIALDKYLTETLPVHASRACYWALEKTPDDPSLAEKRGCKFCAHYKTYSTYYERSASEVVDDMELLNKKYGTRLFHLTDDALKLELGVAISEEIQRRGLTDFKWLVYARLEKKFTLDVLQKWYDGGARVLEWGLESASQPVLNAMNKAVDVNEAQRVLIESDKVGILNKLFMFHNFPTETVDDLKTTLSFLYKNTYNGIIRPFPTVRNKMYLLKNTALYNSLENERLYEKVWKPSGDFSISAMYIDLYNYSEKVPYLEEHLSQIKKMARDRYVFSTDDENVMFDLVVCDLMERGYITYYGSK